MERQVVDVDISGINVGERFREELGDLTSLTESIIAKGVLQPITITPDKLLLTGRRRMAAAEAAGLDRIPVLYREVVDDLDFREIELMENVCRKDLEWHERCANEAAIFELKKTKEGWSQAQTAEFLEESVGGLNRHLQLADAIEVMPELKAAKTESDAWKVLKKAQERVILNELANRGDKETQLSSIGEAMKRSYIHGDAIEGLQGTDRESFGFAEVDPPYGVNLVEEKRDGDMEDYHEVPKKEYKAFTFAAAQQVYKVLKDNSFCIWWYGPSNYELVKPTLKKAGFAVHDIPAIWWKGPVGQSQQPDYNLANCYEPFFICTKGQPTLADPGTTNVFFHSPVSASKKIHPTERPIELMAAIYKAFVHPTTAIVSPFLGSGVAIKAAISHGCTCVGWDLSTENRQRAVLSCI